MRDLRKVAETLAAYNQGDLAKEVALLSLDIRKAAALSPLAASLNAIQGHLLSAVQAAFKVTSGETAAPVLGKIVQTCRALAGGLSASGVEGDLFQQAALYAQRATVTGTPDTKALSTALNTAYGAFGTALQRSFKGSLNEVQEPLAKGMNELARAMQVLGLDPMPFVKARNYLRQMTPRPA